MALHRRLDKILNAVPKPKGAVPDFGLPKWKFLPMDAKIPLVPGLGSIYTLSRRKLGRGLWTTTESPMQPRRRRQFDSAGGGRESFQYNALHDGNLAKFFLRPLMLEHLMKMNLVTEKLDVRCSFKEYNDYRAYLREFHGENVCRELDREAGLSRETRTLALAERGARKDAKRCLENAFSVARNKRGDNILSTQSSLSIHMTSTIGELFSEKLLSTKRKEKIPQRS